MEGSLHHVFLHVHTQNTVISRQDLIIAIMAYPVFAGYFTFRIVSSSPTMIKVSTRI